MQTVQWSLLVVLNNVEWNSWGLHTNSHSWRSKIKCNLSSLLLTHKHSRHTHPRINAHAHHKRFSARLLRKNSQPSRLMKKKNEDTHYNPTDAQGQSPPIQISVLMGDLQVINREQRLARQSLVNFVEYKSCQVEDAGDGVGGADTHDAVIRIQEKIVARETYTTDIGPFERRCVLLCLVALLRTKRIGLTETGRAP